MFYEGINAKVFRRSIAFAIAVVVTSRSSSFEYTMSVHAVHAGAERNVCNIVVSTETPQTTTRPSQTLLPVYKLAHLPMPHTKSSPPRPHSLKIKRDYCKETKWLLEWWDFVNTLGQLMERRSNTLMNLKCIIKKFLQEFVSSIDIVWKEDLGLHVASILLIVFCFFLFNLILYVHSTIFQLCGTGLPGLNQY